jgi:hypothetical protein
VTISTVLKAATSERMALFTLIICSRLYLTNSNLARVQGRRDYRRTLDFNFIIFVLLQARVAGSSSRKGSQLFIHTHNEMFPVAMRVNNPDCVRRVVESGLAILQCFPANFPLWRQK